MTTPFAQDTLRVCLFQIAAETFALRLDAVREIVPMATLSRPPAMPSVLEGFLNLGGEAIPVLRLATLLGLPAERLELHTPLIIIRAGTLSFALLVKRVTGIVIVPSTDLTPIAETDSFNACVEGRLLVAGDVVHVLSVGRLLLEKEHQTLVEFQATETRRLRQMAEVAS